MKQILKSVTAGVLSLQLAGLPLLAADSAREVNPDRLKARLEESFRDAEKEDWSFLNGNKQTVNSAELIAAVMKNREFYAVSPHVDELDARMTVHFKLEAPTAKSISFKLSVLDKDQKNIISARKFVLDLNPDNAEATKLRFARAFRSMSEEIKNKKDQLASLSLTDHAFAALQKVSDFIVPRAEAKPMKNTAEMLKVVAGGACTIGAILTLISIVFIDDPIGRNASGKWQMSPVVWLAIVGFVLGGVSYIGAGIVEDLE